MASETVHRCFPSKKSAWRNPEGIKIAPGYATWRNKWRTKWRVNDVFDFIRKNQGANTNDIAKALDIPTRTVSRYLKSLSDFIEFRGAPKNGGYFLKSL